MTSMLHPVAARVPCFRGPSLPPGFGAVLAGSRKHATLFAALALAWAAAAPAADAPVSSRMQKAIDQASGDVAAVRDYLDGGARGDVDSALADLQSRKNEIDRRISDWESAESGLRSDRGTADRLRLEWEGAKQRFEAMERNEGDGRRRAEQDLTDHDRVFDGLRRDDADNLRDHDAYERDVDAYENARQAFEGRGGTNDEPEYARLNRWFADLKTIPTEPPSRSG